MRIDIEKCNDIELLRREAFRLIRVVDCQLEQINDYKEEIETLKELGIE